MSRPVVLSNGQLFVGLDENGLVHDFYYPYVGLDNLTNARSIPHKIGVWVDGQFSWVDDGNWEANISFEKDALISRIKLSNAQLKITIELNDFIDNEYNAFVRRIRVVNELDNIREIRLFMHQVFEISRSGRADTVLYVPDDHYLLDYKGRCCLLIAGKFKDGAPYDQYSTGSHGVEGKEGTYKDAEDGELSDNPVEHGGVDSVIRFARELGAGDAYEVDYWVVAADSQSDAQVIHTYLKHYDISERLDKTRTYWHQWIAPAIDKISVLPENEQISLTKSLLVIKAHCDNRGSILASGDSSIFNYGRDYYCYCWPRDGAYAIWPLIRLGLFEEARNFFMFSRDTMHRDGYMMHKYQPDRAIGSTWHPLIHNRAKELAIQEDETASVIFMLGEYYRYSNDKAFIENFYDSFISPCAHFLSGFVDQVTGLPHASYDLWEEKFLTTTYSVSTVISALSTAAGFAKLLNHPDDQIDWQRRADSISEHINRLYHQDGYYRKGMLVKKDGSIDYDDTLDISSLFGVFKYSGLNIHDEAVRKTFEHVKSRLATSVPIGGVIRYENDNYFRTKDYLGNPWIVCSLWLAQYYIAMGDKENARNLINWSLDRQLPSGILSEQFDPESGAPLSVTPLVWSHAELINALLEFYEIAS